MAENQAFTKHVPAIVQFEKKTNKTTGIKGIFQNDNFKFVFRMGRVILCQIKRAIPWKIITRFCDQDRL